MPCGRGETILLVEDEDGALRATSHSLSRLGYRVIAARDGEEALQLDGESDVAIDLLVTDIVLPHVNGVELANLLLARHAGLPVVFMSGHAAETLLDSPRGSDSPPFIQKPFSLSQLATTIHDTLNRSARRRNGDPPTRKFAKLR